MNPSLPLVAVDAATAAAFLLLASIGVRHRTRPSAVAAALLWCVLAVLAAVLALGRADIVAGRTAMSAVIVCWIVAVPLWAGFVFEHTGRGPSVNHWWSGLAVVYAVVTIVTSLRGAMFEGTVGQLVRVGTSILQTALIGVGLFGVFLLVRSAVTYDDITRRQGVALSTSGIAISLFLFSVSTLGATNPARLPWAITAFLSTISGAFVVSVVPYQLFRETPRAGPLARSSVLKEMSEAVVVVDREDRLVDANAAAERSLGIEVARDAGRSVRSVLGWDPVTVVEEMTTVSTPGGQRQFDVSRSPLTNRSDDSIGTAYVFQDVTDQRTREQRLEVLNRVLRHNLRNDLDAIRAFAEALSTGDVDEPADVATRIRSTASDLVDIGATVERAEQTMAREALELQDVEVEALAADVADHVREQYECHIEIIPNAEDPSITTDRGVLHTALIEVVENAVEHTDDGEPIVTIDVDSTESGVNIAIRDQGPGIPDRERAVLLEGKETPLQHGTGVGLWLVSWAVTRLGGELSFEDVGSGSRVIIDIPDQSGTSNGES